MQAAHKLCCLAVLASACVSGDLPPRPSDSAADAEVMCAKSQDLNECYRCTDENCCEEYERCKADPRCTTYYKECLPECDRAGKTFDECVVECSSSNGAGHATYAPYFACGTQYCFAECALPKDRNDACVQCMYASCRDEVQACHSDSRCNILDACLGICLSSHLTDPEAYQACADQCRQEAPSSTRQRQSARITCTLEYCANDCADALLESAGP